jgi:hypothetical protein
VSTTAIIVAVVAGALAIVNTVYTARLQLRLEQQRAERTKREVVEDLMARYREPLLRASFDFQSRLYNIVEQSFLDVYYLGDRPDARIYARDNTLYVVAEYLGWVEIIRREVRFLDLGDEQTNRIWAQRLDRVRLVLLTDRHAGVLQLFNGQQRAIGELMTRSVETPTANSPRLECMGYAEFVARQQDPDFAQWFARLRDDVDLLAHEPQRFQGRVIELQHALIDLIDVLDPGHQRLPEQQRRRLGPREGQTPA